MRNSPRSGAIWCNGMEEVEFKSTPRKYASDALLDPLKDLMPMGLKSVWQASAPVSTEEI